MFKLKTIEEVNRWIGKAVSFFVLLIMGITLLEVFLRYGFNRPTMWVHETSQQIFAIAFLLGSAYTLQEGGHVRVDIIHRRLSTKEKPFCISQVPLFIFSLLVFFFGKAGGWHMNR